VSLRLVGNNHTGVSLSQINLWLKAGHHKYTKSFLYTSVHALSLHQVTAAKQHLLLSPLHTPRHTLESIHRTGIGLSADISYKTNLADATVTQGREQGSITGRHFHKLLQDHPLISELISHHCHIFAEGRSVVHSLTTMYAGFDKLTTGCLESWWMSSIFLRRGKKFL